MPDFYARRHTLLKPEISHAVNFVKNSDRGFGGNSWKRLILLELQGVLEGVGKFYRLLRDAQKNTANAVFTICCVIFKSVKKSARVLKNAIV